MDAAEWIRAVHFVASLLAPILLQIIDPANKQIHEATRRSAGVARVGRLLESFPFRKVDRKRRCRVHFLHRFHSQHPIQRACHGLCRKMTTCYPPVHHHSTTHISTSTALLLLSTYLEATITDPALHPNALLTDSGPITPSSGANIGFVLHNLKRVEAGLEGEHLGADLTFTKFGTEVLPDLVVDNAPTGALKISAGGPEKQRQEISSEWQDKEIFEQQQDVMQGEIGRRENTLNGDLNESGQVPRVRITKSTGEIDARREAKKDRRRKERLAREGQRNTEKDAEG